jgi:hypothetical protein
MAGSPVYILHGGSVDTTFEQTIASVQNHGLSQSVLEVERVAAGKKIAAGANPAGTVVVLRPFATGAEHSALRPGDRVSCNGLGRNAGIYRVRRMADGYSRNAMKERA